MENVTDHIQAKGRLRQTIARQDPQAYVMMVLESGPFTPNPYQMLFEQEEEMYNYITDGLFIDVPFDRRNKADLSKKTPFSKVSNCYLVFLF